MFSSEEKRLIADKIEELLLSLGHPEMPKERPSFALHVDGAEDWSWADIQPNWKFQSKDPEINPWNEKQSKCMVLFRRSDLGGVESNCGRDRGHKGAHS